MTESVTPFLMFTGEGRRAMDFYVGLFADAEVLDLELFGEGQQGPAGTVQRGLFRIGAQTIRVFDSPVKHAFDFTPAISLFVECASLEELTGLAGALGDGGTFLMPLGDYGFSRQFAWLNDRFGVSWQLNLV